MEFIYAERLEVDDRCFFQVHERLCLEGGDGGAFLDMYRRFTSVVLDVVASIDVFATFFFVPSSIVPPFFPNEGLAPYHGFYRAKVFFCFGAPTHDIDGVRVRAIRFVVYRDVRLLFCGFLVRRVAKGVRRGTAVDGAKFVYGSSYQRSFFVGRLRRDLGSVRRSYPKDYAGGCLVEDCHRGVSLKEICLQRFHRLFRSGVVSLFYCCQFRVRKEDRRVVFRGLLIPLEHVCVWPYFQVR